MKDFCGLRLFLIANPRFIFANSWLPYGLKPLQLWNVSEREYDFQICYLDPMDHTAIPVKNKLEKDQLFKISRFKERIKRTRPHKHDGYFELIYIREGEGFHWVDTDFYQITSPEIYFLKPGCLHCWQFTAIPKGYVILFKEEYFDAVREKNLTDLFRDFAGEMQLPVPETAPIDSIFLDILKEYQRPGPFSYAIIHGYMQVLFSRILQLSNHVEDIQPLIGDLISRFQKLLNSHCPDLHLVHEYADLLATTPQNLNAACRKHLNMSASEIISGQLLLEAKRHILHTENSIAEIAFNLHFNDASYFIKFFKKHTGTTPMQFRKGFFQ